MRLLVFLLMSIFLGACTPNKGAQQTSAEPVSSKTESLTFSPVERTKAMRRVMWQGELAAAIRFDTVLNKKEHYYGLGPLEGLQGELLILNDTVYKSTFLSEDSMRVEIAPESGAPFFVGSRVATWKAIELSDSVLGIKDLEQFLLARFDSSARFAFRLRGSIAYAEIHLQNLPNGAVVRSPKQAHAGQRTYHLQEQNAEILGFFSTQDQGVFTHHDSFLHLHLISENRNWMGHLDSLRIKKMHLEIGLSP